MSTPPPQAWPRQAFSLLPVEPTTEMVVASGLDESAARELWARMSAAAPGQGTYACSWLTERKTIDIAQRGYRIVGPVLLNGEGRFCISAQAAVRWLSTDHYNQVMHSPNEKLFGQA